MKLVTATAAAFLLMTGMAFAQQSAMASKPAMRAGTADVEQNLKDMENQWAKASLASDGQAIAPLLSEDFVNIDSDGSVHNKAETVARASKMKFEVSELSELQVTSHGDSAVVTGIWTGKGTDSMGKSLDTKERWADTWVKKDGKWRCVASASAPLAAMEPMK
jgi:ketosteroid isomerase-like protein